MRGLVASAAALAAAGVLSLGVMGISGPSVAAASTNHTVVTTGTTARSLRFSPANIHVNRGDTITWTKRDAGDDPHTATVIPLKDIGISCGFTRDCQMVFHDHFPSGPTGAFVRIVNQGPAGFNQYFDSALFGAPAPNSVTVQITAPAGTSLKYQCVIHPWMNGTILIDS